MDTQTAPPALPQAEPQKPRRPWFKRKLVLAAGVLLAFGIVSAAIGTTGSKPIPSQSVRSVTDDPNVVIPPNPAPYVPEEPTYAKPSKNDFTVALKITRKQCFGSAGCNISYRALLTYKGDLADLDPEATYELTYEVRGGEDGPAVDTLTIQGTSFDSTEDTVSTSSARAKLTVRILSLDVY